MIYPLSGSSTVPPAFIEEKKRYFSINMAVTNRLIDSATSPRETLYTTASKIACYTVVPFLLIALFEAAILNPARVLANCAIAIKSSFNASNERTQQQNSKAPSSLKGSIPSRIQQDALLAILSPSPITKKIYACTEGQQEAIFEIIHTVANNGKFTLLFSKKARLDELESQIKQIHPFMFLKVIIADPKGKKDLGLILTDPFKRLGFMRELEKSLNNELRQGSLYSYLNDFSTRLNLDPKRVGEFIKGKNWDKLLQFLTTSA